MITISHEPEWIEPVLDMRDDRWMSIDPVAVYAAVVATGALGWQVYQWRYERRGKLRVGLRITSCDGKATMKAMIANPNSYAVRLEHITIGALPDDDNFPAEKDLVVGRRVMAAEARLPAIEVPAHDSLHWTWEQQDVDALFPRMRFLPGGDVQLSVKTTLGFRYQSELVPVAGENSEDILFAGITWADAVSESRFLSFLRARQIPRGMWTEADEEPHDQPATQRGPGHEKT
jgi:hypothetical protein